MASPASESNPSNIEMPAPEASDSAEVTSCLEAAAELWKSGQTKEAIRFIQRGAEAAEQDGNDMRALKLARLGADLSAQVAASAAPAAPAAPSAPTASSGSNGASAPSASPATSVRPHPAHHPSVRVSQPPPLPGGATPSPASVAPKPSASPADKERARGKDSDKSKAKDSEDARDSEEGKSEETDKDKAAAAATSVAAAPPSASSSSEGPASARAPSKSRAPQPAAERASVKPSASRGTGSLSASAPPKPSIPAIAAAQTSSSVAELIASGLAERVSVKRSSLDTNLLVVRPISGNGAKPSRGARQAVLIYVDGDSEA